jgi:hypothetical protein
VCAKVVRAGDAWFASDRATRQPRHPTTTTTAVLLREYGVTRLPVKHQHRPSLYRRTCMCNTASILLRIPRPACRPRTRRKDLSKIHASLALVDHTNSDNLTCYLASDPASLRSRKKRSRAPSVNHRVYSSFGNRSAQPFFILHHRSRCMKVC